MSTVLFNPTNERFMTQYIGEDVALEPYPEKGHMLRVDDARGRHVLNVLGPRGLCTLNYGDDDEVKKKKAVNGIARNKAFKRKMIIQFNQHNQSNEQRNLPHLVPSEQLKQYANEMGIGLIEPYTVADEERAEISMLKKKQNKDAVLIKKRDKEIEKFKQQISGLTEQVANLISTFKDPGKKENIVAKKTKQEKAEKTLQTSEEGSLEIDSEELRKQFVNFNKEEFNKWIQGQEQLYKMLPVSAQEEILAAFSFHNPGKPFIF